MPHDEGLATKVREILAEHHDVDERRMFGGIAFMVNGHMCCGVLNDDVVLRLGLERAAEALKNNNVRPMDFTGRPMKGFVFVGSVGVRTEAMLRWRMNLLSTLSRLCRPSRSDSPPPGRLPETSCRRRVHARIVSLRFWVARRRLNEGL